MKNIILVTHGDFAKGILSSLQLVMGDVPGVDYVSITAQETIAEIVAMIREKKASYGNGRPTVIITDIAGGSTTRAALEAAAAEPGIYVLTGLNLGLLLEVALMEPGEDDTAIRSKLRTAVDHSKAMMYLVDSFSSDVLPAGSDDGEL